MAIEYDPSENHSTGIPFSNGQEEAGLINKKAEGGAFTNESVGEYATAVSAANEAKQAEINAKEAALSAADSAESVRLDAVTASDAASEARASELAAGTSETNAATSAQQASNSAINAAFSEASATSDASAAANSAIAAAQSETNALTSATNAATSETNAAASAVNAATSETNSSQSESNAALSAESASSSETNAALSESAAEASATAAALSESAASVSASDAFTSKEAAEVAKAAAEGAQAATESLFDQFGDQYLGSKSSDPTTDNDGDPLDAGDIYWNTTDSVLKFYDGASWVAPETLAENSASAAAISESNAAISASAASASALAAATSEGNAASSATSASISETNSSISESSASASATNAATSASNAASDASDANTYQGMADGFATSAGNSATAAAISATSASTSATSASDSASAASTSETNAGISETNAASSAVSASESATAAASSATSASDSATSAATSETNAATSATNASTSETNANVSETNAASSASAAAASAVNAATSESNAQAVQQNLYSIYLGLNTEDPTLDLNGNALTGGEWYYNTTSNVTRIYNGASWVNGAVDTSTFLLTNGIGSLESLQFTGGVNEQGTLSWNTDEETLDLIQGAATLQLGQEMHYHARNNSGATILNGTPVMVTGTLGASGRLTIAPMDGTNIAYAKYFIGLATEDIVDGADGKVTSHGKVRHIDTTALGYTEGAVLWISTTNVGELTDVEPTTGMKLPVAFCIHEAHNGAIFVRANNGHALHEAHDVTISNATDGQLLTWDATNSRWVNADAPVSLPDQTGNSGKFLTSDGTSASWRGITESDITDFGSYLPITGGTITDGLTVEGDLVVNGTTTTVSATNLSIADNMIYLNDGSTQANADLGWVGNYNDGTYAHAGFFRDASDGYFKAYEGYTPEPDEAVDIDTTHASFTLADIQAANFRGNLIGNADTASTADKWDTARTITLTGDVNGSVSIDGSDNVSLATTIQANSVALGTDTTGNYAAGVSAGNGIVVSGTAGEGTTFTVAHADTSSQASVNNSGNTFIQDITLDTYGHITGIASVSVDIPAGYDGWNISDGTNSENVIDGSTISIVGSGATSTSYDTTTNTLTITSTDTDTVYTHPSYNGDDFSVDTGPLTGATVVSDIDINVTTDTLGHVTDANGVVSTRTLTLGDLGYTGASDANKYVHPTHPGDDINLDTGPLSGATVISDLDFNVTTDTQGHVTDANATYATRNITAADVGAAPASHSHSNYFVASYLSGRSLSDANNADGDGITAYYLSTGAANSPAGTDHSLLTLSYSSSWSTQEAADWRTNARYIRKQENGNWSSWQRLFADDYHPNADKWTTARTLALTGDVTGSVSWDGSGNVSMTTAVANDSHNHDHSDGNFTVNGALYVAPTATSSNIYMGDTDHGSRRIHNNSNQIGFLDSANGWGCYADDAGNWYSTDSVRSPIFYDSNDTNYYLDPANSGTAMKLRGKIILEQGNTTVGGIELNSVKDSTWPFEFTTNDVGNDNPSGFWVGSNGYPDMRLRRDDGTVRALISSWEESFVSNGFRTDHLKTYHSVPVNVYRDTRGSGNVLYDLTAGLEEDAVVTERNGSGAAGSVNVTAPTGCPAAGGKAIGISSGYSFYSDYIEVEPGETLYGEVWAKKDNAADTVRFYYGIERFDKDKRPIASNTGCTYFVAANASLSTSWTKYAAYHTVPTSHTSYGGSDGSGVKYVRVRFLGNYQTTGQAYYAGLKLMRAPKNLRSSQPANLPIIYDIDNTGYYSDPASTSRLNAITANKIHCIGSATNTAPRWDTSFHVAQSQHWYSHYSTDTMYAGESGNTVLVRGTLQETSDERLKSDIEKIDNAVDKVKQLGGYTYNKVDHKKRATGVIAQEVLAVLPEAVSEGEDGYYSVAYGNMVGLLIEAIKEQQNQIDELKTQLSNMNSL